MISFEPTEEEVALREVARRFALDRIRPAARACEEAGTISDDLLQTYHEIGLAALGWSDHSSGSGLGARAEVLAEEELAWGDAGISAGLPRLSVVASAFTLLGESVRDRWLAPLWASRQTVSLLLQGESCAVACESEDATGVAIRGIQGVVLGSKHTWAFLLPCALGHELALLLIPAAGPGLGVTPQTNTLGLCAAAFAQVRGDHVLLPWDHVLAFGRPAAAALCSAVERDLLLWTARLVGIGRAAFEYASRYSMRRTTFGRPIAEHQAVAFMVADMGIRVDCSRNLLWQAAWAADSTAGDRSKLARSAATFAAEAAIDTTNDAVQTLGGHGYVRDHPVEKWMRDARAAGNIVAEELALLERIEGYLNA